MRLGNLVHMKQHSCIITAHAHTTVFINFRIFLVSLDDIISYVQWFYIFFCLVCKQDGVRIHYKQQGIEAVILF